MYTHEHIHMQDLFNKLWHDLVQETVLIQDVFALHWSSHPSTQLLTMEAEIERK